MFSLTLLLNANQGDEQYIEKCFSCEEKVYNVIVKHCVSLLNKLKFDKNYQILLECRKFLSKKNSLSQKEEKELKNINKQLNDLRKNIGLTKFDLEKYAKVQQWKYSKYVSSQMIQVIAGNVWTGVEDILFDDGQWLHYKKKGQCETLSAKSTANGIKIDGTDIILNKQKIGFIVKDYDDYAKTIMAKHKPKFGRIIRKPFNNGYRYYIQFIFDGIPPLKHEKGTGTYGIDPGVSSIAGVGDNNCILEDLAPDIQSYNKKIVKLQKQLERIRRLNNPQCYNPDGTIIKSTKFSNRSKHQMKVLMQLKTLYRKRSTYVRENQCRITNIIIENCDTILYEDMNFKALQKRVRETNLSNKTKIIKKKDGTTKTIQKKKKKKRFGKTLNNKSPSQFLTILTNKANFYDIPIHAINTKEVKASQLNHVTGQYVKKQLKDRWAYVGNNKVQRDLYSAFLIKHVEEDLKTVNLNKCKSHFKKFVKHHNKCIARVKVTNHNRLSCFGF